MKYIFINNFRGFSNAYIPVRDVNFLVGQNSTGKTSLLGLLRLFSSPQFIFDQDFSDECFGFGTFDDMVSAHSEDRRYFNVGMAWNIQNKKTGDVPTAWLMTFVEDDGIPRLSRYTYSQGEKQTSLRFRGDGVLYKKEACKSQPMQNAGKRFEEWVAEHASSDKIGYEKLVLPSGFRGRLPLLLALSMALRETDQEKPPNKKRSIANEFVFNASTEIAFTHDLTWIAPIRTQPLAYYGDKPLDFDPEGEHTPYLIRKIFRSKSDAAEFHKFIDKVGRASGLFEDVIVKNFPRRERTGPFEIDIVLDSKALKLTTVGYGVSQALPVLVEIFARPKNSWFAIQQPEVHLHPRAQAALGDTFFEMATLDKKKFLIETHSDFTIDRFRLNYRSTKRSDKPDAQVLFFERRDKKNVATALKIDESGELPSDQPASYQEFFIKEELRAVGL